MKLSCLPTLFFIVAIAGISGCRGGRDAGAPPVDVLRESAKNLVGNHYVVEGRIESLIANAPSGRLFAIKLTSGASVPVYCPSTVEGFNPEMGQSFRFNVAVDAQGVLVAEKAEKT